MPRIADLRPSLQNIDDARRLFDALVRDEITLAAEDAKFEARVANLKTNHAARTDDLRSGIDERRQLLADWIVANQGLFEKPKKHKTDFGAFGLRTVTDVLIPDEAKLLEWAMRCGYDDCMRVTRKPIKPAIRARLEAGEPVVGATLRTGPTVVYEPSKTLIAEAVQAATGAPA